jgi:hypothetical protein
VQEYAPTHFYCHTPNHLLQYCRLSRDTFLVALEYLFNRHRVVDRAHVPETYLLAEPNSPNRSFPGRQHSVFFPAAASRAASSPPPRAAAATARGWAATMSATRSRRASSPRPRPQEGALITVLRPTALLLLPPPPPLPKTQSEAGAAPARQRLKGPGSEGNHSQPHLRDARITDGGTRAVA